MTSTLIPDPAVLDSLFFVKKKKKEEAYVLHKTTDGENAGCKNGDAMFRHETERQEVQDVMSARIFTY